ncbi:hypothetical protein [Sphingomonas immobilis]|uniref:Uncharacterized protein n=1 Tax=Sphingomonas immobilis TaxID=3063997 RepID=A0ABT9A2A1_9SPHN|nr:hypothetical protein [Sphingomonas sp. CA1-15]MDO7843960.1 hypothetical protein [Sphingomonas sp. CA1-15]
MSMTLESVAASSPIVSRVVPVVTPVPAAATSTASPSQRIATAIRSTPAPVELPESATRAAAAMTSGADTSPSMYALYQAAVASQPEATAAIQADAAARVGDKPALTASELIARAAARLAAEQFVNRQDATAPVYTSSQAAPDVKGSSAI